MRIAVTHSTIYTYEAPVFLEPQVIRLRPRDDGSQRLARYELSLDPAPAGRTTMLDHEGNVAVRAWFDSPTTRFVVRNEFEAWTSRENPFDFILPGPEFAALPMKYPEPVLSALAPCIAATRVPQSVRDLAGSVAAKAGGNTLAFLSALNIHIAQHIEPVIREEGDPLTSDETLGMRAASCRDVAVLFCDACRAMGIAARFVSGYEREAAGSDQADMHAWAEVFIPGAGWRGFDPSQGLAVSTSHVAVAAAADPLLAAPISGTFRGPGRARMKSDLRMSLLKPSGDSYKA